MHPRGTILLAHASRYGSTQEVAETIAAELRAAGLDVEEAPMRQVGSLEPYAAVVLGAAIYNARWHDDAHGFLSRHADALAEMPVAIFALGPLTTGDVAMSRSRRQLDKELQKYPWLRPVAQEMFVGKMDPAKLGFLDRLGSKASDKRDWNVIRAWARSLAVQLRQALVQPTAA